MSFLVACCLEIILGPSQQPNQAQDSEKPLPQGQGHGHGQQSNDTVNVVELQPISTPTPTTTTSQPLEQKPLSYAAQAAAGTAVIPGAKKPLGKVVASVPTANAANPPANLNYNMASDRYKTAESIPQELFKTKAVLLGEASKIIDGDTIKFYHKLDQSEQTPRSINVLKEETFTIRLAGIDCPETSKPGKEGQPFGNEASDFLQDLIRSKPISIQLLDRDQYGRIVARVIDHEGRDCSQLLLQQGLAFMYKGKGAAYGGQEAVYNSAMNAAKSKKLGVWSSPTQQTPAEYKRAHKQ